jgi:hypothetical protein
MSIQAVEAVVEPNGETRLLSEVVVPTPRRALVMILDEAPPAAGDEYLLLSEPALAEDWNRPEEDAAWSHLLSAPS